MRIRAWAPGRVNLIGEHTDYTGGLVFPMAIQLGTSITGAALEGRLRLTSTTEQTGVDIAVPIGDPSVVEPTWGRYVAGVAAQLGTQIGFEGTVESDLPAGAGLSSSAALEVAAALAFRTIGASGGAGSVPPAHDPVEIAEIAQRAEQHATGVPCGIMDQLASAAGVAGHALRIDCSTLEITPVPLPDGAQIVVVHSGEHRTLVGSAYAERRAQCEAAAARIGPLRAATLDDVGTIDDPTVRRRARHVVTENLRVDEFGAALVSGDLVAAGAAMRASHASLRDDFAVSTPTLDALVEHLNATPGVFGARLTGAGFGGCVVALCEAGIDPRPDGSLGWSVRPSGGAFVEIV